MTPSNETLPHVQRLSREPEIADIVARLNGLPHLLLLDSAARDPVLGRYSFLMADPFELLEAEDDASAALTRLRQRLKKFQSPSRPGLPPFQGGAAGLFSYDLNRTLERIPRAKVDEFGAPVVAVGLYDVVLAIDHVERQAWIISHGFPETDPQARRERASARLKQFQRWLQRPPAMDRGGCARETAGSAVRSEDLAPQFPAFDMTGLTSNFTPQAYQQAIQQAIDYIYAGDVFQVNLAQRLLHAAREPALALYLRLRERNPAPFAGYYDLGRFQIASASPERFVSVLGGGVEARPIKGTRQRSARPEADLFAGDDLLQSEKDRSENVMIVDLLRNDLSRVCRPESVRVSQLCGLEVYQYVQHLVSVVRGELDPVHVPLDLIQAAFPGGSITGAPKVRAMELIAQLEPTARGPYCGSLGYLGFNGALDLSILIRTITAGRGWWQLPVGGGIVAQSKPAAEYEETRHKARGLLRALEP